MSLPPITPMITSQAAILSPTVVAPPPELPNPYVDVYAAASVAQQAVATVLAEDDVEEEWKTPLRRRLLQEARDRYFPGATWKWLRVLHSYFLFIHKDAEGTDEQFAIHVRDIIRQRLQAQDNPAMTGQVNSPLIPISPRELDESDDDEMVRENFKPIEHVDLGERTFFTLNVTAAPSSPSSPLTTPKTPPSTQNRIVLQKSSRDVSPGKTIRVLIPQGTPASTSAVRDNSGEPPRKRILVTPVVAEKPLGPILGRADFRSPRKLRDRAYRHFEENTDMPVPQQLSGEVLKQISSVESIVKLVTTSQQRYARTISVPGEIIMKAGQFDTRLSQLLSPAMPDAVVDKVTRMQVLLQKIQFKDMDGMILQAFLASESEALFFMLILNLDGNLWESPVYASGGDETVEYKNERWQLIDLFV